MNPLMNYIRFIFLRHNNKRLCQTLMYIFSWHWGSCPWTSYY